MGVISDLNCIEKEYNEAENSKSWKILFTKLKDESDKLNRNIEIKEARNPKNKVRNRYRDVLPFDYTRVPVPGIGETDYINANFVQLDSCENQRRYILTQGPLMGTMSHFWKMVWEEHSICIVMLNKIIEKDMIKCAQYFPITDEDVMHYEYDDLSLSLTLLNTVDKGTYVKRTMSLENKLNNEIRKIVQYHYLSWPDFGVPLTPISFLDFLWDIRSSGGLDNRDQPCIVHCSAGIGRSGTFVLIDLALLRMAENNGVIGVDIHSMLLELRKCRMGLVQAAEQLKFAYLAIIVGAKSKLGFYESIGNENDTIIIEGQKNPLKRRSSVAFEKDFSPSSTKRIAETNDSLVD